MTTSERIQSLQNYGYELDEARFLCTAALHSGYFLRRQFLLFIDGTKGWKDVAFLNRLKIHRHCRVTFFRHSRMVYHLSAKPLYEALGEQDNRNRREHQPSTIKNKIMGLDYVLEHSNSLYLATEREKLDYFVRTRNIAPKDLPTRLYSSPHCHDPAAKHFVESYPIFLSGTAEEPAPRPHFCYVDEGLQTTDRFATYLNQYGRLFAALGDFHVIYAAESPRLFASAERIFQRFLASFFASEPVNPELQRLIAYFRRRRAYEDQDFSEFDTATLIQFREEKKKFAGESYEALYTEWKSGNPSFSGDPQARTALQHNSRGQFSTYLLDHDYELFGSVTRDYDKRTNDEIQTQP